MTEVPSSEIMVSKDIQTPATILIVDDNAENRLLLSAQLKMEGYGILQADGGAKGVQLAQAHDPDIVLLDVMMPDMDGFEVCRALKADKNTHLIPVIMVTALREMQYKIQGIEVGADEFLSRPHVREELLVRVRTLINLKRARTTLEEERNRLQLLYNVSRAINTKLDLETTMAQVITETQAALGATKGNIMLLNAAGEVNYKFLSRAGEPLRISDQVTNEVMSRGLGGWLVSHNEGDIIDNILEDARWVHLPDDREESGSAIGVPLSNPKHVVGVMILNHPRVGYFTHEHLSLLEAIAAQAVVAIENASLFTEVREEQRKLQAILSQSTDAIITTDEAHCIAIFNQAAESVFDIEASMVIGKTIGDVADLAPIVPLFSQSGSVLEKREVQLANGRYLYASISPIRHIGYAVVLQDITELKRIEELKLEQERREKKRVKETFSSYMGPRLVEHVLENAPTLMSRRERRNAVVMFADLRNWTGGMITKVDPNKAIDQLNEYFTQMMEIALEHDGTVFELTGDEMLVGFNAPFDQPNAAFLALKTAVTMQNRFNALQHDWYTQVGTELGLGIGINLGEVVMGNVGAESRLSFRMVGEAMNKASRLVDLAEDGQIIISTKVYDALREDAPEFLIETPVEPMEGILLKGIASPQTLYRVQVR